MLYLPNSDAWAQFRPGRVDLLRGLAERLGPNVVARILEAGYNLDFIDDEALDHLGRYRIVVLPGVERLPVATVRRLETFARGGGAVVATRRLPALAPGFLATEAEHRQVREISSKLARLVEDENRQLANALAAVLRPDVLLAPPAPEIGFVHRSTEAADIYFLANTGNIRRQADAIFRVEGMEADWWDPLTGRVRPVEKTGATIHLDLEPYGSRVLVFSKRPPARVSARVTAPAPLDISAGWKVTFGPGGKTVQMDRLRSWTGDEDTRWYSGPATYEKDIQAPEDFLRPGLEVRLDFGEGTPLPETRLTAGMQAWLEGPVREAAVVYVNDRRAGSVWCPPYSLDVTGFLQPGLNRLRIVVANLAVNHMAGRRLPDYRLLNLRYGVRFEAQDMDKVQAIPSGLLGPIRLKTP